jgi:alpha-N-acetylglucosaminidase
VAAAYDVVERLIPNSKSHFALSIVGNCPGVPANTPCFTTSNGADGTVVIAGTSASELTFAIGEYLREDCNMSIGWKRGGNSNLFLPKTWPTATAATRRRIAPWSYMMNVCTHSYSLVWYDWAEWTQFIDWMAMSGINLVLAMTGQEEIQYKVFRKFGVTDSQIRNWFNGPALLTWSRGQNEYGAGIAGPLPRSWMQSQWVLQKQILARYRSLGIVGMLPGFQGNVPIALKAAVKDSNMTDNKKGTAWMDALDPNFGKIADVWMQVLIEDFGTDHWYQLDGYFNGKTAPWEEESITNSKSKSPLSPNQPVIPDPTWMRRGLSAYGGLNRTDPEAIWSFQGWAIDGWETHEQAQSLRAFIDAAPKDKFVIIDMSVDGKGEWQKWHNASYWGAKFIWTTLHNFGGTDGMKGDLGLVNEIPFAGLAPGPSTSVWGTGFTPEGIDQNPVYYEFAIGQNFREERVPDIAAHVVDRSHRRYGLSATNTAVTNAWRFLVDSAYARLPWDEATGEDAVQDLTAVGHVVGDRRTVSRFLKDNRTPNATLCKIFLAWEQLVDAGSVINASEVVTYRYDLVNLGRELLAQLTSPAALNFSVALAAEPLNADAVKASGEFYAELLHDMDTLVATDSAFLLGPWLLMARRLADTGDIDGAFDCENSYGIKTCSDFLEWNARVQLTTWKPTPQNATEYVQGSPEDYASKHWSGLLGSYYAPRVEKITKQALADAAKAGGKLNTAAVNLLKAKHAYKWQLATEKFPTVVTGDALAVSKAMLGKYRVWYSTCARA